MPGRARTLTLSLLLAGCASSSMKPDEAKTYETAEEAAEAASADDAGSAPDRPIFREGLDPARFADARYLRSIDRDAQDRLVLPWDGDTASFDLVERELQRGRLPPAGAMRATEFVNALTEGPSTCDERACLRAALVPAPHRADRAFIVVQLGAGALFSSSAHGGALRGRSQETGAAAESSAVTVYLDDGARGAGSVQPGVASVVRRSTLPLERFLARDEPATLLLSTGLRPMPDAWVRALKARESPLFILGFGDHQDRELDRMSALSGGRYGYGSVPREEARVALRDVSLAVQLLSATRRWRSDGGAQTRGEEARRGSFLLAGEGAAWAIEVEPGPGEGVATVEASFISGGAPHRVSGEVKEPGAWAVRAAHAAVLAEAMSARDAALLGTLASGPLGAYATRAIEILEAE